jgi:hypothetical protein
MEMWEGVFEMWLLLEKPEAIYLLTNGKKKAFMRWLPASLFLQVKLLC